MMSVVCCFGFLCVLQHLKPPQQSFAHRGGFSHILVTFKTKTMSVGFSFCYNLWNHDDKLQLVIVVFVALCKLLNQDDEL
jgi:predicted amidohydrolase